MHEVYKKAPNRDKNGKVIKSRKGSSNSSSSSGSMYVDDARIIRDHAMLQDARDFASRWGNSSSGYENDRR